MALSLGASAVWVGTRFVAAKEAGAPPVHQKSVVTAGYHDTVRTLIFHHGVCKLIDTIHGGCSRGCSRRTYWERHTVVARRIAQPAVLALVELAEIAEQQNVSAA